MLQSLLPLILLLALGAVFAGFAAGLLGIGGGIVLVPILFMMLQRIEVDANIIMHICVATSLATIIPTSISSVRAHMKHGNVNPSLVRKWGGWIAIGALAGALVASGVKSQILQGIFALFLSLIALNMLRPLPLSLGDKPPQNRLVVAAQGLFIGVFSSVLGIGGGSFSVPMMSGYQVNTKMAVGTASVFGFTIAVPAAIGFVIAGLGLEGRPLWSLGYIWGVALVVIVPITVCMAPVGARAASKIDAALLRKIFAVFLLIAGLRMGYALL